MTEAFPLAWPAGWPRTDTYRRQEARFNTKFAKARDGLLHELHLMGARYPVLSTNIPLRRDGLPYASQANPDDPGVAVYFEWKGKSMTFACDRWRKVEDNVQAVRKTVEAIRGIERWSASDMMERAFQGFEALPAPGEQPKRPWRDVLLVKGLNSSIPAVALVGAEASYRTLARERHPDQGGDETQMAELNIAIEQARKELRA